MTRRLGLAAALSAALAAASPAQAAPPHPSCGQVVTRDVRLTADLVCGEIGPGGGPGLVIGADGVTVDLAGHAIDGGLRFGSNAAVGIDNGGGFDRVTIRNGSVFGFGFAIVLQDAGRNRISGTSAAGGTTGVTIEGGGRNAVVDSAMDGRAWGLRVEGSPEIRVLRDTASGTSGPDVELNADHGVVRRLTTAPSSTGVVVRGSRNRIADSTLAPAFGHPLAILSGTANVAVGNRVGGPLSFGPLTQDGIVVAAAATRTVLLRNLVTDAADDGIDVEDPTARLVRNTANDNGDLGIEAVPGVTGRANRASGNGNPLQCVGVPCAP